MRPRSRWRLLALHLSEVKHLVLFCHDLVMELVNQSLEDSLRIVCKDKLSTIIFKLRERLLEELQGCDIKSNSCSILTITEVSRELHQTMGTKESIEIALLLQQSQDYQLIAKILKKHLLIVQHLLIGQHRDVGGKQLTDCSKSRLVVLLYPASGGRL